MRRFVPASAVEGLSGAQEFDCTPVFGSVSTWGTAQKTELNGVIEIAWGRVFVKAQQKRVFSSKENSQTCVQPKLTKVEREVQKGETGPKLPFFKKRETF